MATTKIFSVSVDELASLKYIANPEKTDNGRLIFTQGCSADPEQAHRDFEEIRENGTGRSTVLAQHFIVSFKPGEITPERALQLGQEICEQFLKGEYQYFMTCHIDKNHTHLHCVFNNTNCIDGRTFETHENRRTTKQDRSFQKLMNITDEVCRQHHLSVIDHPERGKGKSHWEWDMSRQGLSWKAKLKFTIDQVIKESENFEDFLRKCADFGVLVEYNPDHKIDLKFMLAEQKERNPRAKMTRAKTLGWFYETDTIKGRIAQFRGGIVYVPRTKIRERVVKSQNKFVQDAIDRGNMKVASIAKNIIAEYGVEPEEIRNAAISAYAHSRRLVSELNNLKTEIEDLEVKLNVLKKYRKVKHYGEELKALSGRAEKKYKETHSYELSEYGKVRTQVLDLYPSGHIPTVENLEKSITALRKKLSAMNTEYNQTDKKARELADAQRTIEEYLRQEQSRDQQKRKKRNDLE
ncbi:MAG: relaxase/mobilization nuclease domain-containing protein [Oribacterium sp.]|nr:relaxase/mobilization nuclease domain-containing protein [Oribacterium sp.]MBP1533831.1 relaxase/mobilization nuclease domain-containing protein [Ruminococcus sp.]